jgi:tetratricopeptide (TPR) repeat protein
MTSSTDDRFFNLTSSSVQSVLALVIFLGLSACTSTAEYQNVEVPPKVMRAYLHDKPEELHPFYQRVLLEGDRNLVLNHMEAGLAAIELGALKTAEESFDAALLNIETVFTDNESAEKARSLWYEEGRKFFKGEPYERAMAYYYRGLLYLNKGDYENARASFKGGILQDAIAEEERYRADFALLIFLEGWASHLLGDKDLAKSAFDEVKTFRPDFIPPKPEDNVLLIAETGWAPMKVAVGPDESELIFERAYGFRDHSAQFHLGLDSMSAYPMEDIFWQANTRGGREVDKILAGKVQYKKEHEEMGRALTDLSLAGLIYAPHLGKASDEVAIVAGIIGIFGIAQRSMAAKTQTRADTRFWGNLPDQVHIQTLHVDRLQNRKATITFHQTNGQEVFSLKKNADIHFPNDHSGLLWTRAHSALMNFNEASSN